MPTWLLDLLEATPATPEAIADLLRLLYSFAPDLVGDAADWLAVNAPTLYGAAVAIILRADADAAARTTINPRVAGAVRLNITGDAPPQPETPPAPPAAPPQDAPPERPPAWS